MSPRKGRKTEHTEEWADLVPLFWWPEQEEYEEIRPLVLFGDSVAERAVQTGSSERTLYRRISGFENEGMLSLFGAEPAKRQVLPLSIRRMILDLKAEYPPFNANEISGICYACSGREHLALTGVALPTPQTVRVHQILKGLYPALRPPVLGELTSFASGFETPVGLYRSALRVEVILRVAVIAIALVTVRAHRPAFLMPWPSALA